MGNNTVLGKADYQINNSNTLSTFFNYMRSHGERAIQTPIVLGNVGLPLPEETILAVAGYLVWRGELNLIGVLVVGPAAQPPKNSRVCRPVSRRLTARRAAEPQEVSNSRQRLRRPDSRINLVLLRPPDRTS